jgi:hypothetical protein
MAFPLSQELTMSFALKIIMMTEEGKVFLSPYEERKLRDVATITIVILIDLIDYYLHANMVTNLAKTLRCFYIWLASVYLRKAHHYAS